MYIHMPHTSCHDRFFGLEERFVHLEGRPPRLIFLEMTRAGMNSGHLCFLECWVLLFQTGASSVFLCRMIERFREKESHFQDGEEADRVDF